MSGNIIFILFLVFNLMGCNKAIKEFVATDLPSDGIGGIIPATGKTRLKVSPGTITSSSSSISMKATVTPTDRLVKSSSMSAELTIHSQRVTQ